MTNTRTMILDKTPVGRRIKGMTRQARPSMHVFRGVRYVTPSRLFEKTTGQMNNGAPDGVEKKSPVKMKEPFTLKEPSAMPLSTVTETTKTSDGDSLFSSSSYDSAPFELSVRNNNGSISGPNVGDWCNWLENSRFCNNLSPYDEHNE
jgi:hypothetical protein